MERMLDVLPQVETQLGGLNPCLMNPIERDKKIADLANREPGRLDGFNCPKCLNRGYFHRVDDDGYRYMVPCECMSIRKSRKLLEKSGLSDLLTRYTMETWEAPEDWQKKAKEAALRYVEEKSGWFVMAGSVGAGKTHLCTALCGLLLNRGLPVRYALWRDVSIRAKAVVNDDGEYQRIVEPLKRAKVLYIDDLFKTGKGQEPTTGDVNLAFELLNDRYNDTGLLTVISTERTMSDILAIDEALGSRIYERAKKNYIALSGKKNWRMK